MLMRHHVDSRMSNLSLLMAGTNISFCIWSVGALGYWPLDHVCATRR